MEGQESDVEEAVGNQLEEEQVIGGKRLKRSCRDRKEISYREVGEEEIIEDQEDEQTDRTEIMVSEDEKEIQIRKPRHRVRKEEHGLGREKQVKRKMKYRHPR